ncbi:MAG TPA: hypothetical protein VI759_02815 [Dehalococcoidia bacterium]|nr:hypothetical protein [Dehalococcoidia bacterium]
MPAPRCLWCPSPPFEEVAVSRWQASNVDDKERLTVALCRKHLERLRKSGDKGRETKGWYYKVGWW